MMMSKTELYKGLFPKASIFLLVIAIVVFAFTRLYHFTILPIFNDEAFYLHWASIIHSEPRALWLPLVDGKTPLFYWLTALVISRFNDPLVGGRLISVLSGFISLLLLYRSGKVLGTPLGGALSGWLYVLLPYAFFNDRLATVDSFHTMFVLMVLHATLLFSYEGENKHALYLGLALSGAFLAKTPALLFLPLPLITVIGLRKNAFSKRVAWELVISYFMLVFAIVIYLTRNVPMIGEDGSRIFHRGRFFLSFNQILTFPLSAWVNNLKDLLAYIKFYYTIPLLLWLVLVVTIAIIKKDRLTLILTLWSLMPVAILVLVTKETFSRYYLAPLAPSLLAVGYSTATLTKSGSNNLKRLLWLLPVVAIFLMESVRFIFGFVTNPTTASLVARDRWQYIEGYPSGYGLNEVIDYLRERAESGHQLVVFTTMNWGNPADAVKIYLQKHKNVEVVECYWWEMLPVFLPEKKTLPVINDKFRRQIVREISMGDFHEFYFVTGSEPFSKEYFAHLNPHAELVVEAPKPGGASWFFLYRLK